jgi:predicted SnoaL-like aldol condensation-catalyzing enzyme
MTGHRQAAVAFLQSIIAGKIREAYRAHVAPNFKHHNPYFKGDADSLMAGMLEDDAKHPGKQFEVKQVLEDGDRVAVHSFLRHTPGTPGMAVLHIFRFEGDKVVELWDMGMPLPEHSPNENGAF